MQVLGTDVKISLYAPRGEEAPKDSGLAYPFSCSPLLLLFSGFLREGLLCMREIKGNERCHC
jgi:hypothetical protein